MDILAEQYLADCVVRILEHKGVLRVGFYAYENADCPDCNGDGYVDNDNQEPCHTCKSTGEIQRVSGEPAYSRDDDESFERQYLALWQRYGRLDVRDIHDYWMEA